MYVQLNIECDTHDVGPVISAGEPSEVFKYDAKTNTYEIDPYNLYCTEGTDVPHEFVMSLRTSDGLSVRFAIPKHSE